MSLFRGPNYMIPFVILNYKSSQRVSKSGTLGGRLVNSFLGLDRSDPSALISVPSSRSIAKTIVLQAKSVASQCMAH